MHVHDTSRIRWLQVALQVATYIIKSDMQLGLELQ